MRWLGVCQHGASVSWVVAAVDPGQDIAASSSCGSRSVAEISRCRYMCDAGMACIKLLAAHQGRVPRTNMCRYSECAQRIEFVRVNKQSTDSSQTNKQFVHGRPNASIRRRNGQFHTAIGRTSSSAQLQIESRVGRTNSPAPTSRKASSHPASVYTNKTLALNLI